MDRDHFEREVNSLFTNLDCAFCTMHSSEAIADSIYMNMAQYRNDNFLVASGHRLQTEISLSTCSRLQFRMHIHACSYKSRFLWGVRTFSELLPNFISAKVFSFFVVFFVVGIIFTKKYPLYYHINLCFVYR